MVYMAMFGHLRSDIFFLLVLCSVVNRGCSSQGCSTHEACYSAKFSFFILSLVPLISIVISYEQCLCPLQLKHWAPNLVLFRLLLTKGPVLFECKALASSHRVGNSLSVCLWVHKGRAFECFCAIAKCPDPGTVCDTW